MSSSALANEHQVADPIMSSIELTNSTGTYLNHLNEDSLLGIFASSSLTAMDLCSLAETCKRFNQITQRVFPKEFGIECHRKSKLGYKFASKIVRQNCTLQDVKRILKNFGSHLGTLKIDRDLHVVNLVAKYCGDATLRHLQISGLKSIEGVRMQLNSIIQRLLELSVCDCDLLVTSTGLNCDSLIELRLVKSSGCVAILQNMFPKLERFTWDCSTINTVPDIDSDILLNFIRRHGHLKSIDFNGKSTFSSVAALHAINSSCKDLHELTLNYTALRSLLTLDISTLGSLAKLKTLFVEFGYKYLDEYIPLVQALDSLETLKISQLYGAQLRLFDAISQLQNLRELHLIHLLSSLEIKQIPWTMLIRLKKVHICGAHFGFYGRDLPGIIRQLVNLEELEYECTKDFRKLFLYSLSLRQEIFSEIVEIVEGRDHVLTLKCYFTFNYDENCDDDQKVKLINLSDNYCDEEDDNEAEIDEYGHSYRSVGLC